MDSQSLIATLIKSSLLSADEGGRLLKEATLASKPVEEFIAARRIIGETDLARVKSEILSVPFQRVKSEEIPDELLKLVPQETAQTYKLIPISREKDLLVVGMVNPDDSRAQDALRFIAQTNRLSVGVYLVTPGDWELALRRYSPYKSEIEAAVKSLNIRPGQGLSPSARAVALEDARGGAEDAPIIRIVASTLKEAVQAKASDIHVEPMRGRTRIRFRIDGSLEEVSSFTNELHQPIISRVKILANLKIDETRVPQDGRFRTVVFGRDIDFRVSTFPTPLGEKVAIRVLDPSIGLKGTDALGLDGKNGELVRHGLERPFGMILITGPTGSG
ncbi:MAG: Flp pilus assembly complex ATPase component TadA, partial [Candidatus Colwellbacteria bacterium]|nr:Flp pilus assembly complex ATPase component TadA [Candidatus Colwellbacteria bacterium]